jgi:F0F1-type ATP synthase assembly protein I
MGPGHRDRTRSKEQTITSKGQEQGKPGSRQSMWLQAASLSYLGIFFGISVVIGMSCGGYLDKRFHTTPVLRIVGVLFGLATGFNELYRIARRYQRSQQQANAPEAKEAKDASRDAAANPTPAQDQAPLLVNQTNDAGPAAGSKAESSDEKDQDGDEKAREEDRERKDSWV